MAGKIVFSFLFVISGLCIHVYSLQLKQVLILSRHNLRTPFTSTLTRMTPKEWPKLNAAVGHLTQKGALLESYMGDYFTAWLNKEGLLSDRCPEEKDVYIYANTRQRTKETAIAFSKAAFRNCNVTVHFKNSTEMDPIFSPVILNTTDAFKEIGTQEIQEKLNKIDLRDAYLLLNNIIDVKNSPICLEKGFCDLSRERGEIVFEVGKEPNITGTDFIANCMVDSFLMSFYEGLPMQNVAWGKIQNKEQWKLLMKLLTEYQNIRFNLTSAKDFNKPLVKFMKGRIETDVKFTLLVGHDFNLIPTFASMGFEHFVLPEEFEVTPIGSKLVFQKWTNGREDFLKVEFVYQSWKQLKNTEKLSLDNPPKNITLYMNHCIADNNGFCKWQDFEQILSGLVN